MSIIRRALLIVPASLAAFALSGTAAQADPGDVVFGEGNSVSNSTTNNNLVWIDDSFNNVSTVDVDLDVTGPAWSDWHHGDWHHGNHHDGNHHDNVTGLGDGH